MNFIEAVTKLDKEGRCGDYIYPVFNKDITDSLDFFNDFTLEEPKLKIYLVKDEENKKLKSEGDYELFNKTDFWDVYKKPLTFAEAMYELMVNNRKVKVCNWITGSFIIIEDGKRCIYRNGISTSSITVEDTRSKWEIVEDDI